MTGTIFAIRERQVCIILKNAVGDECHIYSVYCIAFVGANSFAPNFLFVRMNSHLRPLQLRFLGLMQSKRSATTRRFSAQGVAVDIKAAGVANLPVPKLGCIAVVVTNIDHTTVCITLNSPGTLTTLLTS